MHPDDTARRGVTWRAMRHVVQAPLDTVLKWSAISVAASYTVSTVTATLQSLPIWAWGRWLWGLF